MSSGESKTRLSSALQKGLISAQKAFCLLIPIQQRVVWVISLLLAANIVLFSTWVAFLSTKAITETKLFSSGLLPYLPTITIIAWLLPDIRNWLVTRIGSCLCHFWGAVTQLYWCKPWDAVRCQLDTETAKEKPQWRIVVLLSLWLVWPVLILWLVWLILAVSSATEHMTRVPDWLLPAVGLAATTCLPVVSPAQWKKRLIVVLLSLLWLVWLILAVSSATEHMTRVPDWLLQAVWLAVTTCLLVVSSPAQRKKKRLIVVLLSRLERRAGPAAGRQWKKRLIVVLLSLLWLVWLILAVWSATEHVTRVPDWLPWSSRVRSTIDWLSAPDWFRSAWPVATAFLLVVSLPAQWNKRQPSTDKNESNVQSVMTFWNYGKNTTILIKTVLLTWMLTLVYVIVSVGLTLVWIGYNVTKDGVQRDKIVASVDTLLQNHSHPRYLFEEGAVFSLLYPQQGDPASMVGICPAARDNLAWLRHFKSALRQCRERPQIEVSGLASIAPGHDKASALLNLQIANMRTVSVAAVLLAESTPDSAGGNCLCGSSFSDDSLALADTLTAHCGGARDGNPDHPIKHRGDHFDVSYTLWRTYETMHKNVQVNDESSSADGDDDRRALEFLNRTVQITIQNDMCRY